MNLILASQSPRRQELLSLISNKFKVIPANINETLPPDIDIYYGPEFLSVKKAESIAANHPNSLVIGADTGVFINNKILGKPANTAEASEMLNLLSGKTHLVITGCALFFRNRHLSFSEKTEVEFYKLTQSEIDNYISTGSPMDKAGAYGIQDSGCLFVKRISGDYFNVVGLPVAMLNKQINTLIKLCGEQYE